MVHGKHISPDAIKGFINAWETVYPGEPLPTEDQIIKLMRKVLDKPGNNENLFIFSTDEIDELRRTILQ
jgi:hypothetical protein